MSLNNLIFFTAQTMKFHMQDFFLVDLITFTEKFFHGKLHIAGSAQGLSNQGQDCDFNLSKAITPGHAA